MLRNVSPRGKPKTKNPIKGVSIRRNVRQFFSKNRLINRQNQGGQLRPKYPAGNWLQNYYYRINLRVAEFVFGFVIAISIALITISYRTIKSVQINPADTLRYE